jgi:hypothetical protein
MHNGDTPEFYGDPIKTYSEGSCVINTKRRICPFAIWMGLCKYDLIPSNGFTLSFEVEVTPANAWSMPSTTFTISPDNTFIISSKANNALQFFVDKTGALYAKDAVISG